MTHTAQPNRLFLCAVRPVANLVLHAFLFHLAIQDAATEFHCAGQMHRIRDARAVGCHSARFLLPFFGVNGSQRIITQNRTR
jgi:hypothetical protein